MQILSVYHSMAKMVQTSSQFVYKISANLAREQAPNCEKNFKKNRHAEKAESV